MWIENNKPNEKSNQNVEDVVLRAIRFVSFSLNILPQCQHKQHTGRKYFVSTITDMGLGGWGRAFLPCMDF